MKRDILVVDASVAVKWVLPEEGGEAAATILDRYQNELLDVMAPYLIIAEVGNALWKRARRGDITHEGAQRCFDQFLVYSPILLDSPAVNRSALQLAILHGHPLYDCLYVSWALEQRCNLVTADERLFRTMGKAYSCVKLLKTLTT